MNKNQIINSMKNVGWKKIGFRGVSISDLLEDVFWGDRKTQTIAYAELEREVIYAGSDSVGNYGLLSKMYKDTTIIHMIPYIIFALQLGDLGSEDLLLDALCSVAESTTFSIDKTEDPYISRALLAYNLVYLGMNTYIGYKNHSNEYIKLKAIELITVLEENGL